MMYINAIVYNFGLSKGLFHTLPSGQKERHHSASSSGFSPASGCASTTGSVSGVGSGCNWYSDGSLKTGGGCTGKNEISSYLCPVPT
jgi:hypothetical protein